MPPVSVSFYRWLCASAIIIPIGYRDFYRQRKLLLKEWKNVLLTTLCGISFYSPLIYLAGHYSPAINLALIGTTATPVLTFIIAAIWLKEKIPPVRLLGLFICMAGIILLLSKGSWHIIANFRFTVGDKWMLLSALLFALYNIFVRKKNPAISPLGYLFATFILGTILLVPPFFIERAHSEPIHWTVNLFLVILYSGAGTSVAAFFCWNAALARIGSAKTSVFGNTIPVFASLEAIWLLKETVSYIQVISMVIVTAGLILATAKK